LPKDPIVQHDGAERVPKPRVLIANRGEIAVRIIRTVRELGYTSIAVYSDADRDALHVEMADQAHRIGPALAADSYLSIGAILEAASRAKATMIHPGYGFLSERAHFARAVADSGFTFIGPPADAIEMMGDKSAARRAADRVGVPIVPGTPEPVTIEEAPAEAERIGFPVLVKAAFGGGGKGMQAVRKPEELEGALARATRRPTSAGPRSSSSGTSIARTTSRRRCSRTPGATCSSWGNATARSSAGTRS
jgi:acetyl/propionyl-CoA carboxylase alpha subunit